MSKLKWTILGAAIGACLHTTWVDAGISQSPGARPSSAPLSHVFRSSVNLVALGVTVTDGRERHVAGLSKADFTVYEDGKLQELAFFSDVPAPLDLAILLDTSSSMQLTLKTVQDAAVRLAGALRPGDRASFTEVKRGLRTLQPLTGDFSGLDAAIRATKAGGETAIYDALYVALRELQRAVSPDAVRRQAIVVLSDGDDTASLVAFDDVLDAARRSGVAIYCVSLRPPSVTAVARSLYSSGSRAVDGDFALRAWAQHTGGRAFFQLDIKTLAGVCEAIARELVAQYSLGYVSTDSREDGRFRQVAVQIATASDARARTRPGYFAPGRAGSGD
jgi:Ca-activated chloride channel homolog